MLIESAPLLLLIGVSLVIGFAIRSTRRLVGRRAKYIERSIAFMDREEQLLERIAVALERQGKLAG